jgi:hypothetical protein
MRPRDEAHSGVGGTPSAHGCRSVARRFVRAHPMLRGLLLASLSWASLPATSALGAPPESSAVVLSRARASFQQALALETAGDWAGASNLLQQVAAVRLTPQVRFHLALCEEHLGNLAAAIGDYQIASEEARRVQATEVIEQATARAEALRARIPKLVLRRGAGAESATISLDGVTLGASSVGIDLPINPGPHTVEAQARGYRPFARTVEVVEKDRKEVDVALQPVPPPAPPPEPRPMAVAPAVSPPPAPPPRPSHSDSMPFIVGGLGIASLATSGVFFALRSNAVASLDAACPDRNACPADLKTTYDHGRTYTLVADVTLGAGVGALGIATALYFLGRGVEPRTGRVTVVPFVAGVTSTGVQATATW